MLKKFSISEMVFNPLFIVFGVSMIYSGHCSYLRQWNYEPLSIITSSSDESKLKIYLRMQRVSRGEYAISGTIDWNYDTDETTLVEFSMSVSPSGSEDEYRPLPFKIEKQPLSKTIDVFYEDLVLGVYRNCSNIPDPADVRKMPFPKNHYIFNKCVANGDGLPNIMPSGYYKVVLSFSGEVDWGFTLYAKVTTKRPF